MSHQPDAPEPALHAPLDEIRAVSDPQRRREAADALSHARLGEGDLAAAAHAALEALYGAMHLDEPVDERLAALEDMARRGRRPETVGPWLGALFLMERWPSIHQLLYPSTGGGDRAPVLFSAARALDLLAGQEGHGQRLLRWALAHGEAGLKASMAVRLGAMVEEGRADVATILTLARVRADAGAFEEAMAALERAEEMAQSQPDALTVQGQVILEGGRLITAYGDQPEEAVHRFYEALVLCPGLADEVEEALEDFLERWGPPERALTELSQLCERLDRGDLLVKVLQARLEHLEAEGAPSEALAPLLLRLAEHAEYVAYSPRAAFDLYRRGLEVADQPAPFADGMRRTAALGVEGAAALMEPLLRQRGLWRHLVRLWRTETVSADSPEAKAALLLKTGEVLERQLSDPETALSHYEEALRLTGDSPQALAAAARGARRLGDWAKVDALLARLRALPEGAVAAALTEATVAVTERQDAAAAGRLVGELITGEGGLSGPDQWAALSTEDLIALAPVVRACAEDRGGAVGAEIMMSLAWLLLARPGGAGEARGALHGAVSLAPRPGQVFEAIAARLEAAGGPEALAPWLASAVALPMPADTRARALERSATLYAGPLGQLAMARYPLMALIAAGDRRPNHLRTLLEALEATNAGDEALKALRWLLAGPLAERGGPLRAEALSQCASRLADERDQRREAVALLTERLIEAADAGHLPVDLAAVRDWFAARSAWPDYMEMLEQAVATLSAEGDVATLRMEMAAVAERHLADPARAAQILDPLRTTSDLDVSHIRDELSRLYQQAGDVDRHRATLAQSLAEAQGAEAVESAATRLIEAATSEPRDPALLIEAHKRILALAPDDLDRLDALAALYEEVDYTRALADVLARRWRLDPSAESAHVLRRLCELTGPVMQRWDRAILCLQELLQIVPEDDEASAALAVAYEEVGDVGALLALHRRRAASDEPAHRLQALQAAARVADEVLDDDEEAVASWALVLEAAPGDPVALAALAARHRAEGRWAAYGEIMAQRLAASEAPEATLAELQSALQEADEISPEAREGLWRLCLTYNPRSVEARLALAEIAAEAGDAHHEAEHLGALIEIGGVEAPEQIICRQASALERAGRRVEALEAWRAYRALDPDGGEATRAVRRLAAEQGLFELAVRTLEQERRQIEDPVEGAHIERLWARLLTEVMEAPERALNVWDALLQTCPDDPEGLRSVYRLYCRQGRWREAEEALARLLELAPSDRVRVALRADAARRFRSYGSDPSTAFDHMALAVETACRAGIPYSDLLETLESLAEAGRLWDRLLPVLRGLHQGTESPDDAQALLMSEARVLDQHLGDKAGALSVIAGEFERQPTEGPVLEYLVRLASDLQAWEILADAWRRLALACEDPDARVAWLRNAAEVLEIRLGDVRRAFWMIAGALEAGEVVEALWADLWRLARAGNLWAPLAERYAPWLRLQPQGTRRARKAMALAEILEERLGDWDQALAFYLDALVDGECREAAWSAARRIAEAHGAWPQIIEQLEARLETTEDPSIRQGVIFQLSTLYTEILGDHDRGQASLLGGIRQDPTDPRCQPSLDAFVARTGRGPALAEALEGAARRAAGEADEVAVARRLGWLRLALSLYGEPGTNDDSARVLEAIVELDPEDREATRLLADHLRQLGRYEGLAEIFERRLSWADDQGQVEILRDLWVIYRDWLGDEAKAESTWDRLRQLRPDHPRAQEALGALLEEQGAWASLVDLLAHRADHQTDLDRHQTLRQRARIIHERLKDPARALEAALALSVETPEALDLLQEIAGWIGEEPAALDRLIGRLEEVAPALPAEAQADGFRLLATLAARRGNVALVIDALERVIERAPEDMESARLLAGRLEDEGRFERLVSLLRSAGPEAEPSAPPGDQAYATWAMHVADLQGAKLGRPREAMVTLRGLLERQPDHRAALERLAALAEALEDDQSYAEALEALAPQLKDVEASRRRLEAAARDLDSRGEVGLAVRLWQQLLTKAPAHEEAHAAIQRYGESRSDWALLAWLGQLMAETALPESQGARYYALGQLHEIQRRDLSAAEEAYRRAVQVDPSHHEALQGLVRLTRRRGQGEALESLTSWILGRLQKLKAGPEAEALAPLVAGLQLDRGRLAEAAGQRALMLTCLQDAHRWAPKDEEIGLTLADALYAEDELSAAATLYVRFPHLPEAPQGQDPARYRADAHVRRAMAFKDAGLTDRALRHAEAAIHHPSTQHRALETLVALRERRGQWDESIRLRRRLAEITDSAERKQVILLGAAEIVQAQMGQVDAALDLYRGALEAGLSDERVLQRLLPLYIDAERRAEALMVAERLLEALGDPNRRAELRCKQATLLLGEDRGPEALACYQQALKDSPLYLPAVKGLIRTLDVAPRGERVELLEGAWAAASRIPGRGKLPVLEEIGAALQARGEIGAAVQIFEEIQAIDRNHEGARRALEALYQALDTVEVSPRQGQRLVQAIRHRLAAMRVRPGEVQDLRDLVALYRGAGRGGWARIPLQALSFIGEASEAERAQARQLEGPLSPVIPLQITAGDWANLVRDPGARGPVADLLALLHERLAPEIGALFNAPEEASGTPAEAVHPPLVERIEVMCEALGLPPRPVRIAEGQAPTVSLSALHPPTMLVGDGILGELDRPERQFMLARSLELTRQAAVFAAFIPATETVALMAACLSIALEGAHPGALMEQAAPERVEFWDGFLVDRLSQEDWQAMAPLARQVAGLGGRAFLDWSGGVRRTANRVGWLMCGDLAAAMSVLAAETRGLDLSQAQGEKGLRRLLDHAPAINDLFWYVFGNPAHELMGLKR